MKLNIQLFASGVIPRDYAPSNGDIQIVWSSVAGTAAQNTSEVTAKVQVKRRSSGSTTGTFKGELQVGNEIVEISKKFSPLKNEWKTVDEWTATVQHNPDGTGTCYIDTTLTQTGTSLAGEYSAVDTVTLDTINRVSPVSTASSSVNMGSSINIYTNRYVNTFTHTLRYEFGSDTGTIASNVGGSNTWSVPLSLASQIPSGTSGTCTIYCDTYNGSTLIGTSSCTITLNVPSSVVPSVSFTMEQLSPYLTAGTWVQNKSKATITTTASGAYGSTITGIVVTGDGYTYTGSPVTTNTIRWSAYQQFKVTVTDSRGRTAVSTQTIYVYSYTPPTLDVQVQRCNLDGTINDNGDYCSYVFNSTAKALADYNTPYTEYKIGYRVHNTGDYTYITVGSNQSSLESSGVLSSGGTAIQFSTSNTYDIQFYAKDYYETSTKIEKLDAGFDLMNFNESGKSMAIGKVSERNSNEKCLDIALDTYIGGARIGRIARTQLTSNSQSMELTNLHLEAGRAYKIIVAEYATSTSNHYLRIENDSSTKSNLIYFYRQNSMQTGGMSTYYEVGLTNYGSIGTDVMFSEFTMNYYDANYIHLIGRSSGGKISSGTIMIDQAGSLTEKNLQTINTIGVYGSSSNLIGAGSYIEIWG